MASTWVNAAAVPPSGSGPTPLKAVESVVVMPVAFPRGAEVDDRAGLQNDIHKMLLRKLALKGYVLDRPRGWTAPEDWSVDALEPLEPAALAALLPAGATHVALLFVQRLEASAGAAASSARVAISARIVDVSTGGVLWQAQSEGDHDEHLLSGGLMVGPITQLVIMAFTPDKHIALGKAFERLFEGLPERTDQ